jgi:hypothetical protein
MSKTGFVAPITPQTRGPTLMPKKVCVFVANTFQIQPFHKGLAMVKE